MTAAAGRPVLGSLRPIPAADRRGAVAEGFAATDVRTGQAVSVDVAASDWTLLLFLSAHCDGCLPLWAALADPPAHGLPPATVAVVRGSGKGEVGAVAPLVPAHGTAVVSADAFARYRADAPFFVLVDGAGPTVAAEGVAWATEQVAAEVASATAGR